MAAHFKKTKDEYKGKIVSRWGKILGSYSCMHMRDFRLLMPLLSSFSHRSRLMPMHLIGTASARRKKRSRASRRAGSILM